MKIVSSKNLLEYYLQAFQIRDHFTDQDLPFLLLQYEKGNLLTMTDTFPEYFLFVVSGSIRIYGISDEGNYFSVNQVDPGFLLGKIEFARNEPSQFYSEAAGKVYCVALPFHKYCSVLHEDNRFLNYLLKGLSDSDVTNPIFTKSSTLEQTLIDYAEHLVPDGRLYGVDRLCAILRCQRRQLQRVLKKLCDEGILRKEGRGKYILVSKEK